jgi:dUTP pyrophosphatase
MTGDENLFDGGEPIVAQPTGIIEGDAELESSPAPAPKRKAGRPKGAKNKPKSPAAQPKKAATKAPVSLGIFKLVPNAEDVLWATSGSACFDIHACLKEGMVVTGFTGQNAPSSRPTRILRDGKHGVIINPLDRLLIPTGLILDMPEGHSVRLHPRSGISLKQGLTLANAEGVIDSDYVEQLYLSVINLASSRQPILDGERVAQGELIVSLVQNSDFKVRNMQKAPERKSSRKGGFGHTGK